MAVIDLHALAKRYYDDCYYDPSVNRTYCYNSAWNNWIRWLVLALVIVAALFLFFLFSCISARRRRRMGYKPWRGTAWAAGRTPPGHAPATYNSAYPQPAYGQQQQQPYYNNSNNPPPAYSHPNQAGGYYGGQRNGDVELQQPAPTYSGQGQFAPPPGPPPGK